MIDLTKLTPEELYELGLQFAEISQTRPDITHRFFLGLDNGFRSWNSCIYLCDPLWALWRQGEFNLGGKDSFPIPFGAIGKVPSGSGRKD